MKKNTLRILTGLFTGLFTLSTLAGTTFSYDAVGRVSQVVEPNGQTHGFAYDTLGRVQAHQQPNATGAGTAGQVQYGYTGQGDIASVTDPRALVTSYGVNGLGDASSLSSPDTGGTTFVRDEAGNVTSVTDARGVTVQYTYDGGNRLTSVNYGDEQVTFTYGANGAPGAGLPVSMTDGSGTTTWSYDRLGHVLSKTQAVSNGTGGAGGATLTTSYTWGGDRLASITYPSGAVVSYDYNEEQVASISVNGIPAISNISYAPFGGPVSWVMPGAAGTYNKAYDTSGRVTSYSYDFGSKALEWDASSRLTAQTNPDGTRWTYGYDNLNRLTASNELNRGTRSYKYDLNGNRLTESNPAGTAYTYPIDGGSNRALSQIAKTQTKTYSYDAVGNTLSDSIVSLQWNNAGRLKKVTGVSQPGTYLYNGLGQRVKKSASIGAGQWANVRHFIYAEDRTSILGDYIQTIDGSGNASALSVGSELVYLEGVPVLLLRNGQVYASMPDHLGTVRTIKDANGVVMWRWNSDAFGQSVPEEQPSGQATKFYYQFRFPGQYADGESGMIYNNARYYNPVNGRYYSSDPIGLNGGINTYGYVDASPLTSVDSSGEFIQFAFLAVRVGWTAWNWYSSYKTAESIYSAGATLYRDNFVGDCHNFGENLQNLAIAGLGVAWPLPPGARTIGPFGRLANTGSSARHHIIQDAAVTKLPGYNRNNAPAILLSGRFGEVGTEHYVANQIQRAAGGGTYAAERRIGYKALRRGGQSESEARSAIATADAYFSSIGVDLSTATLIPGTRR